MLSEKLIEKKKYLDILLKDTKNDFDLMNILRKECKRIDFVDENNIVLVFDKAKFVVNKKQRKVNKITTFDKNLREFKDFLF